MLRKAMNSSLKTMLSKTSSSLDSRILMEMNDKPIQFDLFSKEGMNQISRQKIRIN